MCDLTAALRSSHCTGQDAQGQHLKHSAVRRRAAGMGIKSQLRNEFKVSLSCMRPSIKIGGGERALLSDIMCANTPSKLQCSYHTHRGLRSRKHDDAVCDTTHL